MLRFVWAASIGLPSWLLITTVRGYQLLISPWLGANCRFTPTCSTYCIAAVQKYGFIYGSIRTVWRVCRCHPWNPGGKDLP